MTVERGAHTYAEITSQPKLWDKAVDAFWQNAEALKTLWHKGSYDRVLFTGCGSTYYLALAGAALFQQLTGVSSRAYPASEIALYPDFVFLPNTKTLLIAVSRSGETTETLAATRLFRERTGSPVIAVTCGSKSTLSLQADLNFSIDEAQETSLAQTRSFASMMIVVEAIAAFIAGQGDLNTLSTLTPTVARLLRDYSDLARQLGEDRQIERFFFLGSGALYGIACEGMLKMKEMSLSYSEAFHVLEFRHGPMSMVDERSLVIGLITEGAHPQEISVLKQMSQRGAQILAFSESGYDLDIASVHQVRFASGLPEWARPVIYLPVLQLLAYYRAMHNGQNPDLPANLSFVISLDISMK